VYFIRFHGFCQVDQKTDSAVVLGIQVALGTFYKLFLGDCGVLGTLHTEHACDSDSHAHNDEGNNDKERIFHFRFPLVDS
jgi:hypothetical protein